MADAVRPIVELAVLAGALLVAGLLALLQRRPERIPEWPPSPPQTPGRRRRIATVCGSGLLLAGLLVGTLVSAAAALELTGASPTVAVDRHRDGEVDAVIQDAAQHDPVPIPSIQQDGRVDPSTDRTLRPDGPRRDRPSRARPDQAW